MFAFLNKSASFFMDMSLENAGYNCQECKDEGCCPICRSPPCDGGMVVCSDRTCKKWYHLKCENLSEEFVATVKAYYCVSCRERNPKRKIVKYKKSEIEAILNNLKSQKSAEDIPNDPNISSDLSLNDAEASSDFSEINEASEKASAIDDSVSTSGSISENEGLSDDSNDEETQENPTNNDTPLQNLQMSNTKVDSYGSSLDKDAPKEPAKNSPPDCTGDKIGVPSTQELKRALDTTFPSINSQQNKIIEPHSLSDESKKALSSDELSKLNDKNHTIDLTDHPGHPPEVEQDTTSQININNHCKNSNLENNPGQPSEDGLKSDTLNENLEKLDKLLNTPDGDIGKEDLMSSTPHPIRGMHRVRSEEMADTAQLLSSIAVMKQQIKDLEEKNDWALKELEERDLTIETMQLDIQYKTINYRELEENYNLLEEKLVSAIEELKAADYKVTEISKEPKKIDVALLGKKHPKDLIRNFIKLNQLYYAQNRLYKEQKLQLDSSKKFIRKLSRDKKVLEEKVDELIKEDINRKVLNFAMDENQKLTQELQITRQRLFTYKESHILDAVPSPDDKLVESAWETTTDTDNDDNDKDEPKERNSQTTKEPSNPKKDQTDTPNDKQDGSSEAPTIDLTLDKTDKNHSKGSNTSNKDSRPDDKRGQNPSNIRSRSWTASGRRFSTGDGQNTAGTKSTNDKSTDHYHDRRPRSGTGQSNQHKSYYDKRKNIPCRFAINGRCRYTDKECYYYHPKEHQMSYYRGSNWITNKPHTSNEHQQKEKLSDDLLHNIQSLTSLLKDQMQRQNQHAVHYSPHGDQPNQTTDKYSPSYHDYQMHQEERPNTINSSNFPYVPTGYNTHDPNFQQPLDQNTAPLTYNPANSLTYVNQSNH